MKVSTILPTDYLDLVKNDDYHLCLAQSIGVDTRYTEFYCEQIQRGHFVILDNGAAEGSVASIEELYEKAVDMEASELVLPDVFFESGATAAAAEYALNYLTKNRYLGGVMAVPQGRSLLQWVQCAVEITKMGVNSLGIPKNLVHSLGPRGRYMAILSLTSTLKVLKLTRPQLHLLGCWTDPREVGIIHGANLGVRGVDSRLPYLYAAEGWLLDPDEHPKPPKKEMDFSDSSVDSDLLWRNIKRWKGYCYGKLQ